MWVNAFWVRQWQVGPAEAQDRKQGNCHYAAPLLAMRVQPAKPNGKQRQRDVERDLHRQRPQVRQPTVQRAGEIHLCQRQIC